MNSSNESTTQVDLTSDRKEPYLELYCGGIFHELGKSDTIKIDRKLLSNGQDKRLSQRLPPHIYFLQGQWYLRNQFEQNRLVLTTEDDDLIFRIHPQGGTQLLPRGDSVVYLEDYEVGITVEGVDAPYLPPPGDTLGNENPSAVSEVQDLMSTRSRFREVLYVRFQQFMQPKVHNPSVLKADAVSECAPDLVKSIVDQEQRILKEKTGLDATEQLGHWLTHHGLLLKSHRIDVPHTEHCGHVRSI